MVEIKNFYRSHVAVAAEVEGFKAVGFGIEAKVAGGIQNDAVGPREQGRCGRSTVA